MSVGDGESVEDCPRPAGAPDAFLTPEMIERGGQVFMTRPMLTWLPTTDGRASQRADWSGDHPAFAGGARGRCPQRRRQEMQLGMEEIIANNS